MIQSICTVRATSDHIRFCNAMVLCIGAVGLQELRVCELGGISFGEHGTARKAPRDCFILHLATFLVFFSAGRRRSAEGVPPVGEPLYSGASLKPVKGSNKTRAPFPLGVGTLTGINIFLDGVKGRTILVFQLCNGVENGGAEFPRHADYWFGVM